MRAMSVTCDHVESNLNIEDVLRQFLEGEQIHGLVVGFVHHLLPGLWGWFEYGCDPAADLRSLFCTQAEQRQDRRRGMRDDDGTGLQFRRNRMAGLTFDPRRTDRSSGFGIAVECVREVDDSVAQVARGFPVIARR